MKQTKQRHVDREMLRIRTLWQAYTSRRMRYHGYTRGRLVMPQPPQSISREQAEALRDKFRAEHPTLYKHWTKS